MLEDIMSSYPFELDRSCLDGVNAQLEEYSKSIRGTVMAAPFSFARRDCSKTCISVGKNKPSQNVTLWLIGYLHSQSHYGSLCEEL